MGALIFLAILVHKIPASVGLGTILTKAESGGYLRGRLQVIKHLLAFTLTSPIANIVTFLLLQIFMKNQAQDSLNRYVGLLLIFSAGTFLYVSTMHILPESSHQTKDKVKMGQQLFVTVLGMVSPYLLH